MRDRLRAAVAALGVMVFAAPAAANEGMWTFDNFPASRMRGELGWAPDQAWLDRTMAAVARLPGCSGSVVSGQGLVLTNHHCAVGCVRNLSSTDENFVRDGFMARTREEERRCPNYSISLLTGIADVTERINAATAQASPADFPRLRNAEIARIQSECSEGARQCDVVTLYQGGRYALYSYTRFDDVRLVFAPEAQIGAFGGDPDNYNFPRYCLDFSFLRLYRDGQPVATPAHLEMRFTPLEENEIVLAVGNPGTTARSRTVAEMEFARDYLLPFQLAILAETRGRVIDYSQRGPEQARIASTALQGVENLFKRFWGQRRALVDRDGFGRVVAAETEFRRRINGNRTMMREVGDAFGEIERAEEVYRGLYYRQQFLEGGPPRSSLFTYARDLVRVGEERAKPDGERLARYTEARLPAVERAMLAPTPVEADFEQLMLEIWLFKLREFLTVDDASTQLVLGRESPEQLAARLAQSRLADPAYRRALWEGGAEAVAASDDPMIQFVRRWDAEARAVRERVEREVEGPIAAASERIARARFRIFGDSLYPDATGTPRVTYGRVTGWSEPGRTIGSFTRIGGLYDRATGAAPFELTQRWLDARGRLDADTIYNFVSTTESVGGASGSPVLDREGRVVGANFDGNSHATGGTFYYDPALNRTVGVATTAMEASLQHVYGMNGLLAELRGE
ncbi:MAG: S46 family peptidase [Hyphomonadaceae bacterium]